MVVILPTTVIFANPVAMDPSPDSNASTNEQGQPSRQHLVASFFDVIRSRLELFLTEAEEQKWRLVEILIWLLFMAVATDGFGRTLGTGSSTRVADCGAVFLGDRGVWVDRIGGVSGQKVRSAVQPHVC